MSYTGDLVTGVAQDLENAGVGVYRSDGSVYPAGETAIVAMLMPAAPDRCVVLTAYTIDASPDQAYGVLRLQARSRGNRNDPLDATSLDDQVRTYLQGMQHRQYGTFMANHIYLFSSIPLGHDDSDRWEISTNYTVDASNPAAE